MGIEKDMLPADFITSIPHSTASYWRNGNSEKYLGQEFSELVANKSEDLKLMFDKRVRYLKKGFVAVCRIQLTLISIFGISNFKKAITKNKETVINLIERTSEALGGTSIVCKALRIKDATYQNWKRIQQHYCPSSLTELCFKRIPNQVSLSEIAIMKRAMRDTRYTHWPISSVWGYMLKQGLVSMSRSTWYKYCRMLNLSQEHKARKKPSHGISVRAGQVNEIWHMDVSVFKTLDRITYYIYTVVDNFSRKIIAYDVSETLSAEIRLMSLRRAVEQEFNISLSNQSVDLIVDGGSENNNHIIKEFIQKAQVDITMKVALKEVRFSNSIAEVTFKIMKQGYFQYRDILSDKILPEVDFFVTDYNEIRPHYEHEIFTPNEIHSNQKLKDCKPELNKVRKHRVDINRNYQCIMGCK